MRCEIWTEIRILWIENKLHFRESEGRFRESEGQIESEGHFGQSDLHFRESEGHFRSKVNQPVENNSSKKYELLNLGGWKLIYHESYYYHAAYDGQGTRSCKVGFCLVNRVSLIFKA